MELNFDFKIKDLSGNEIANSNASQLLASAISGLTLENSDKLGDWMKLLWDKKPLTIDSTDSHMLYAIIDVSNNMTVLSKQQLRAYMRSQGYEPMGPKLEPNKKAGGAKK